jgi:hypothetical protein
MKLETFDQWKQKICNGAIAMLPAEADRIGYRYSDILDYICEHIDLDHEFDNIIGEVCRREFNTSIYEEYMHTHHTDNLKRSVAQEIMANVLGNIQRGVY